MHMTSNFASVPVFSLFFAIYGFTSIRTHGKHNAAQSASIIRSPNVLTDCQSHSANALMQTRHKLHPPLRRELLVVRARLPWLMMQMKPRPKLRKLRPKRHQQARGRRMWLWGQTFSLDLGFYSLVFT